MLTEETITQRLTEMTQHPDLSDQLWPENCAGSRKALVIFVGPSPGGKKQEERREIQRACNRPLWNEPYNEPLNWSRGFKISFRPIVETIIGKPYEDAAKLIARVNMDWLQNPESVDVAFQYMWEGCSYVLPVVYECDPELIIPMDEKTFAVLKMAMESDGCEIIPRRMDDIKVAISDKPEKPRYHHRIMAFGAKKKDRIFLVIKSLQHPARIFEREYAKRIGRAIRNAAKQFAF